MAKKRILLVEDEEVIAQLISIVLNDYQVEVAHSMAVALQKATLKNFDLYLIDYHLPDGTGLELTLLIRNFDPNTPILFVTGTSSMSEAQAIKIGAKGVIKKGKSSFINDLETRVKEILGK